MLACNGAAMKCRLKQQIATIRYNTATVWKAVQESAIDDLNRGFGRTKEFLGLSTMNVKN
jgi:hypothetical protein